MCPKKKVDTQQGIRLELQESERDMLRLYSTSAAARNVLQGVGAVALPAVLLAGGIAVAAIFDKGYDSITSDVRNAITERQNRTEEEWAEAYQVYVADFIERRDSISTDPADYGQIGMLLSWWKPQAKLEPNAQPLTYEEWRKQTDPERTKGVVRTMANRVIGGLGNLVTFGL